MRQAMGYIDGIEDKETQISLIKTLQAVTEGKVSPQGVHVEAFPRGAMIACTPTLHAFTPT